MIFSNFSYVERDRSPSGATAIHTPGIDFSGDVESLLTCGKYQVWRKAPGTVWSRIGQPHDYVPTEIWLVETWKEDGRKLAKILMHERPGARWAACIRAFQLWCEEAG